MTPPISPNNNQPVQQPQKIYERDDIDVKNQDKLSKVLAGLNKDVENTVKEAENDSKIVKAEYDSIKNLEKFVGNWMEKLSLAMNDASGAFAKFLETAFDQLVTMHDKLVGSYAGDKNDTSEIQDIMAQNSSSSSQISNEPTETDANVKRDINELWSPSQRCEKHGAYEKYNAIVQHAKDFPDEAGMCAVQLIRLVAKCGCYAVRCKTDDYLFMTKEQTFAVLDKINELHVQSSESLQKAKQAYLNNKSKIRTALDGLSPQEQKAYTEYLININNKNRAESHNIYMQVVSHGES